MKCSGEDNSSLIPETEVFSQYDDFPSCPFLHDAIVKDRSFNFWKFIDEEVFKSKYVWG